MAAKTQTIRCINKDDRKNPYERIINVGGKNADGGRWKQSQQQTIRDIDPGAWEYFVGSGRDRVKVITAISPYGNKYIKTEADGKEPNNLLSLPECP
tara:strand:- start:167 stop:457 length:291 start_codon:yes stop_codon:yes gene_type:complete